MADPHTDRFVAHCPATDPLSGASSAGQVI